MQISAKVDYGMRALLALTAEECGVASVEQLALRQELPAKFLGSVLNDLRRAGIVRSQRGSEGGYSLSRPADQITVADVMRALGGPLAEVHGLRPEDRAYVGAATHLQEVWVAVRASLRVVLEHVTLADVVSGQLPSPITDLVNDPDAWIPRWPQMQSQAAPVPPT